MRRIVRLIAVLALLVGGGVFANTVPVSGSITILHLGGGPPSNPTLVVTFFVNPLTDSASIGANAGTFTVTDGVNPVAGASLVLAGDTTDFALSGSNLVTAASVSVSDCSTGTYRGTITATKAGYNDGGTSWCVPVTTTTTAANMITVTNQSGSTVTNYPHQFGRPFLQGVIANFPQVLINGTPVTTQADVKNRYPDGSVKFAVIAVVIPTIPTSGALTLTFQNQASGNNTAQSNASMLATSGFNTAMTLTGTGTSTITTPQTVTAPQMMTDGKCALWTSGPIAQTVICADDTLTAAYDIGFDGTNHPFRPRFYLTFWSTGQVFERWLGEASKMSEVTDLTYQLALSNGYTLDLTGTLGTAKKRHWATTAWNRSDWIGGTPSAQINIDNNLPYLVSTRFIPSYNIGVTVPDTSVATQYTYWTRYAHDPYDYTFAVNPAGAPALLYSTISQAGGRNDISPYPTWTAMWLYTGDWRMRAEALGLADLGSGYNAWLRETVAGKVLSRYDTAGSGTGVGHVASTAGRKTFCDFNWGNFFSTSAAPADRPVQVGAVAGQSGPILLDGAHQPSLFYVPYLLTGDPFYRDEMYMWAGFSAFRTPFANASYGRGQTGAEGALTDEVRGEAWIFRNRAETAFIAPDADPEKLYFTYLTNDYLASREGMLNLTGTPYQTLPVTPGSTRNMWNWGKFVGKNGMPSGSASCSTGTCLPLPTHAWHSSCQPSSPCDQAIGAGTAGNPFTADVGSVDAGWTDNFLAYALYRSKELGFAAGPTASWLSFLMTGIINSSKPKMASLYRMPVAYLVAGTPIPDFVAMAAAMQTLPNFDLDLDFQKNINAGTDTYTSAVSTAVSFMTGETGGAAAWAWVVANIGSSVLNSTTTGVDPRWAIVPRTDTNVLPAIGPDVH